MMGPYQALLLRIKVDQGVMEMFGYLTLLIFPKLASLLKKQFSFWHKTPLGYLRVGSYPSEEDIVSLL